MNILKIIAKKKAVHWSGFIRASDTLSEFWNTFAFLVDQGIIIDGWDFKIECVAQVRIYKDKKDGKAQDCIHIFNEPSKVLFLRLNNVHKHYQQAYRIRTGKEGMSIENLKHYFSGRKYYIGNNQDSRFRRCIDITQEVENTSSIPGDKTKTFQTKKSEEIKKSSSFLFLYDQLGINIERSQAEEQTDETLPF